MNIHVACSHWASSTEGGGGQKNQEDLTLVGPCICSSTLPDFSWLSWSQLGPLRCELCSSVQAGCRDGRKTRLHHFWQYLAQWWVGPLPETSRLFLWAVANISNISLYVYSRKIICLLLPLQLRKELRMMLRRARVKEAGGTWERAALWVEGSPLSCEASSGGHGGVLCKTQPWE